MASTRELNTLKRLISETDLILSTGKRDAQSVRCRELLASALALATDLIGQAKLPAATVLGRKGGTVTAQRGSEYFRQLAARRKSHGGGRPRKETE